MKEKLKPFKSQQNKRKKHLNTINPQKNKQSCGQGIRPVVIKKVSTKHLLNPSHNTPKPVSQGHKKTMLNTQHGFFQPTFQAVIFSHDSGETSGERHQIHPHPFCINSLCLCMHHLTCDQSRPHLNRQFKTKVRRVVMVATHRSFCQRLIRFIIKHHHIGHHPHSPNGCR